MALFRRRTGRSGADVHVADPTYDDWVVVRDFGDLETALAFRDQLRAAGIKAVLTSDWELDRFRRGDIALRVEGGDYGDAEVLLSGLDED
ncbi:MAG TPA: hypothetical protein VE570_09720 [Thermoleophilaceae bacterium]|jgi:hypothetical protein|nr:hypothetical protein [Thermoleophilaceae bacterium]